ncbi:MAG: DeoR/GlpR transcriptional regulator [Clostridiales bacterium]|nr:DeoR/GlpR transcriptional regulator [Clostridiales bacterium]
MTTSQRRMRILDIIQDNKSVEVNNLAKMFSVSTMTIRRDLAIFEKQGLITTNYGGAYLNQGTSVDASFSLKSGQRIETKRAIGYEAAKLVEDGDTIIMDCGTTVLQMAKYLQDKRITIITNSWALINYFRSNSKVTLILAPGEYKENHAGVVSEMTMRFFEDLNADKTFLGTQGLDIDRGATVADFMECSIKRTMLLAGKMKVLLCDHNKFGQTFLVKEADISEVDYLVTDNQSDPTYLQRIREMGVEVRVAE